jgi:protein disulfide-isomerase
MRALRSISTAIVALVALTSLARAEDQIVWQPSLDAARQTAAQTNRLILVHFWAPWCERCGRLDKDVFSNAEVGRALESNFVLVKLNFDEVRGTARLYGVSSLPTDVIISPNGRLVAQIQSPPTASQYVAQMNQAAAGYRELTRTAPQDVAAGGTQSVAQTPHPVAMTNAAPQSAPAAVFVTQATAATSAPPSATGAGYSVPAATTPGTDPTGQRATDDRYADYFRQQPNGAPSATAQNETGQTASPPNAPQQYPPTVTNQYVTATAAQPNPAAQVAAAPSAQPTTATGQALAYGAPTGNQPPPGTYAVYQPQPQLPQLPPGCPPIGLDGCCPVTLVETRQWAIGDKTWGVVHRGRTYLFLGPAEKEKFLANPDR